MKKVLSSAFAVVTMAALADVRLVDSFDLAGFPCGQGKRVQACKSVDGHPLSVGGVTFEHGFGAKPESAVAFKSNGGPLSFSACVAIDDDAAKAGSGKSYGQPMASFAVWADGKAVWRSDYVKLGQKPVEVEVKLDGAKEIVLETSGGAQWTALDAANADWLDARFTLGKGTEIAPLVDPSRFRQPGILTPPEREEPQINGADIFGVRPGHPVIFRVATSGVRPMRFTADGLPEGVALDGAKGILRGTAPQKTGDYDIVVTAENAKGKATRTIRLVVGDTIALTPPMGWNSWNVWENRLTQERALESARAMEASGLGDHGWSYVNLDDFWEMNNEKCPPERPELKGPARNADGTIRPNPSFPDMKGLTDAIHALGFKAGLYSSPGRVTCGGCTGSLGHELQDATSWADWGFDYVKYDWCSYWEVFSKETGGRNMWDQACYDDLSIRESYVKPYRLMGECLKKQKRDILFSLCQYGMAHVEDWGPSVGASCWRSWEDLKDSWHWLEKAVESRIGARYEKYSRPGCWADPDMMIVGRQFSFGFDHPTFLTPAEQYTHVTLWAMIGSPLLVGCDLANLDAFTRNLLVNDEVIAISQDRLGNVARRIRHTDAESVWARSLANGDIAVALVNRAPISHEIRVDFAAVGLEGVHYLRDCWTQRCEGRHAGFYVADVPPHGVKLIRVKAKNCQKCDEGEFDSSAIGLRDPFVLVEDGKYYLYDSAQGETKGVFVRTGTSIREWSRREQVMALPLDVQATDVWAPEVHKFNGRYYLFVTLTEKTGARPVAKNTQNPDSVLPRGVWVFVASSPLGPFAPVKRGPVTNADEMTLDGTLYVEDGQPYMVYCHEWVQIGSGTIEYAPLSDDFSRLTAPSRKILGAREALKGAEDVTDGPFLYRSPESGTLYLIWSNFIEGRGYCVLVRKSLSGKIAGPWSKDEILTGNNGGHGMIFRTVEGELLMALHRPNDAARLSFERLKESNGMLRCLSEDVRR